MSTNNRVYLPLLFSAALIAFVSTGAFASLTDTFGSDVPTFSQYVTLDKYTGSDPLTEVEITLTLQIFDGHFEFDNDGSTDATAIVDLDVLASVSSTDVTLPNGTVIAMYDEVVNLSADDGDNNRTLDTDGSDYGSLETDVINVASVWKFTPTNASEYIGPGTFNLLVDVSQVLEIIADSGINISSVPVLAQGTVSVEYLPEPTTIVILASGGLMLRRRKLRKA